MGRHAVEQPPHPPRHVAVAAEHADRPLAERLVGIGDELGGVDAVDVAEAVAGGAGPERTIEAEQLRFGRRVAHAAGDAGIAAGEHEVGAIPFLRRDDHLAAAGAECQFHGLGQPAPRGVGRDQPVHHDVDRVLELLLERRRILDAAHRAIDPRPREALPHEIGEQILVLPLRISHERREHHHPLTPASREDPLHDLIPWLGLEHRVALGAVGRAHPGVEHSEKVVDLRHRRHGGPRVRAGRLLGDRDRGGEARHGIDVGPGQLAKELPRERGETLDVAALALGVERVEGETGFSGAAHARQADEPAPRQAHGDVAEIVLPRSADDDRGDVHARIVDVFWTVARGCRTIGFPAGNGPRPAPRTGR